VAILTGTSRGLGVALVEAVYCVDGATLLLVDVTANGPARVAEKGSHRPGVGRGVDRA